MLGSISYWSFCGFLSGPYREKALCCGEVIFVFEVLSGLGSQQETGACVLFGLCDF